MQTHDVSVADVHPWEVAPSIRHFEAHALIPVTEVSVAAALEVLEASRSVVCDVGASVTLALVGSGVVAVSVEPADVEAPLQVDDWRARAAVTSAVPQASKQGVTAV